MLLAITFSPHPKCGVLVFVAHRQLTSPPHLFSLSLFHSLSLSTLSLNSTQQNTNQLYSTQLNSLTDSTNSLGASPEWLCSTV